MTVQLFHQHDVAADQLVLRLYDRDELVVSAALSELTHQRPLYWEATIPAPAQSQLSFQIFENGEETPVCWGEVWGLVPGRRSG
jgi:hypothetical protein